ncbi:hypothetical protein Gotur_000521 [Gossypium turneri]
MKPSEFYRYRITSTDRMSTTVIF